MWGGLSGAQPTIPEKVELSFRKAAGTVNLCPPYGSPVVNVVFLLIVLILSKAFLCPAIYGSPVVNVVFLLILLILSKAFLCPAISICGVLYDALWIFILSDIGGGDRVDRHCDHPAQHGACRGVPGRFFFRDRHAFLPFRCAFSRCPGGDYLRGRDNGVIPVRGNDDPGRVARRGHVSTEPVAPGGSLWTHLSGRRSSDDIPDFGYAGLSEHADGFTGT